ncbi:ABC transporter substrate-binding protein [Chitinophaga nivalis]|uniref:ABC transporter substrate-binding protein n=1 Tax=Chitinophaga nivalis TaxID=2991709 RepID=A0ABT3IN23_9BACT|nr:ABC transporter substrate-binding protein [Chitinophaga nivalis]MCW3464935.1 ABC transporter substrate-binding protein [Chitinophaga nivalis]MCW3485373.1 ABC transporter substrate-binding protein [Chitinophaga nivalis]
MKHIFILAALLMYFSACNPGQRAGDDAAITLTDVQGNKVLLNKPAEKIVCLFEPMLDAIYMLQVQHKLVGIPAETYSDKEAFVPFSLIDERIRDKRLAIPGSNETANLESILALKPDLVIAKHMSDGTIQSLKDMGIAVYLASSEKYDQVLKELEDVGLLTGAVERAHELVAYTKQQFDTMQLAAAAVPEKDKKKAYFTWANGRIYATTGRNSMMNDCLEFAGVWNACTAPVDQPNINAETLISWNPDMIVMWNDPADLFYNKQELSGIKAVKNKAIYNLMPMFFYNPHTLKSTIAATRIKGWATGQTEEAALQEVKKMIVTYYGPVIGNQLITLL